MKVSSAGFKRRRTPRLQAGESVSSSSEDLPCRVGPGPSGLRGRSRITAFAVLLILVGRPGEPTEGAGSPETRGYVQSARRIGRSPRTKEAIEKGLAYLEAKQNAGSGAIGTSFPVAVTSLAGLAILGAGYQPNQAPYGPVLLDCVRYLERCSRAGGGFITETGESRSRMHGHGYALLFLSELLGSLEPEKERVVVGLIRDGVRVVEQAQNPRTGGWYYGTDPEGKDENSVTVCVLQALRAARNAGIAVDSGMVNRAVRYVRYCYRESDGSFMYSLTIRNRPGSSYALSVAALSTLNAAGVYDSPELQGGLRYLRRTLGSVSSPWKAAEEEYEYYANFYAAQVLYQRQGDLWQRWYPAARDHLLSKQRSGSEMDQAYWKSRFGDEYATAVAVLILEVPLGYLPIFQR